jgi:hypothetical protein
VDMIGISQPDEQCVLIEEDTLKKAGRTKIDEPIA